MNDLFNDENIVMICPHCGVNSQHKYLNKIRGHYNRFIDTKSVPKKYNHGTPHISDLDEFDAIQCISCKEYSIYKNGEMIYPIQANVPQPNTDMPNDVRKEYLEAKNVLNISPRSACALLRLALEKLMDELNIEGSSLNDKIKNYCKRSKADEKLVKAFNSVRIIGNESVHPGTLDIRDNKEIAKALFKILNYIVKETISETNMIDDIFNTLPKNKTDNIKLNQS